MEIGNLPDGGVVLDGDQFVVARAGSGRRISGARLVRTDVSGNAQLSGDPSIAEGRKLRVGDSPVLGSDSDATNYLYTGSTGLAFRNVTDDATLLTILNGGAISTTGSFDAATLKQGGKQVWHAGNLVRSESFIVALNDEITPIKVATALVTMRLPYNFQITAVRASLATAQASNGASGGLLTFDVKAAGTSIFSVRPSFNNASRTTVGGAAYALTVAAAAGPLASDIELTFDVTQIGDGSATGLKVTLIGYQVA